VGQLGQTAKYNKFSNLPVPRLVPTVPAWDKNLQKVTPSAVKPTWDFWDF